jgi:hypothetical protein
MDRPQGQHEIQTVICNEELWYFRLGTWLGWYRPELTHSSVRVHVMAVPRKELGYWQARLAELKAGRLEDGPARAMFVHEAVHSRQMSRWPFWLWGLRYVLSRRFRRRIEEEAYAIHLTYLAQCGIPLEAPYWIGHFQQLYFGAFNERQARETFERIATLVSEKVPNARIAREASDRAEVPSYTPWLREA